MLQRPSKKTAIWSRASNGWTSSCAACSAARFYAARKWPSAGRRDRTGCGRFMSLPNCSRWHRIQTEPPCRRKNFVRPTARCFPQITHWRKPRLLGSGRNGLAVCHSRNWRPLQRRESAGIATSKLTTRRLSRTSFCGCMPATWWSCTFMLRGWRLLQASAPFLALWLVTSFGKGALQPISTIRVSRLIKRLGTCCDWRMALEIVLSYCVISMSVLLRARSRWKRMDSLSTTWRKLGKSSLGDSSRISIVWHDWRCSRIRRCRGVSGGYCFSLNSCSGVCDKWGMSKSYKPYQPEQELSFPPSLKDRLPKKHVAHFASDVVDELDLEGVYAVYERGAAVLPSTDDDEAVGVWVRCGSVQRAEDRAAGEGGRGVPGVGGVSPI